MKSILIISIISLLAITIIPVYADDDITVTVDKSVYFLRDTIVINGSLDRIVSDEDTIKFEIVNPHGIVVNRFQIELDEVNFNFTHTLSLIENIWNDEGLYRLRASYNDSLDTVYFHVFQSNSGFDRQIDSTIGLHQEQYSWTDYVDIYVVAPNFNRDNTEIEIIGTGTEFTGTVTIKTSKGILSNYKLTETDTDSGIFFGKVVLTGDQSHDVNNDKIKNNDASGSTGGKGSLDGQIASRGSDVITVIFENENEEIDTSSKISWNLGEFQRIPEQIDEIKNIKIRIHDADMNIKQDREDSLYVLVWSDREPESKKIQLYETQKKSGVFEGVVKLSTERTGLTTIKTQIPDVLYMKYSDSTVPLDILKTHSQYVFAEVRIGKAIIEETEPESKLKIPVWIRNNAKWFADGIIGESEFTQGIGYLIKNDIIQIPEMPERSEGIVTSKVPDWVKNNAKWWSGGQISDGDFLTGIKYLIKQGIILVE